MTQPDSKEGKRKPILFIAIIVLVIVGVLVVHSAVSRKDTPPPSRPVSGKPSEDQPPSDKKRVEDIQSQTLPPLVKLLREQGITHENTAKIVLQGSEGGFGSDVMVEVPWQFLIQEIWDTIYQSRPYSVRCACGYRKAHFYAKIPKTEPSELPVTVTLCINATGRCHIEGQTDGFRCPKLNSLVERVLKKEYESRENAERSKYLGEMPSVIADCGTNPEDSKVEFECFYYKKSRRIQKGKITHHLRPEVVNVPIEEMPKPTVDFTRHLIQERFLSKPETWSDGFFGDSKYIKASLRFVPVKDYYGEQFPEIWNYTLSIRSYHPQYGIGKVVWNERFLISKNGYILYGGKRDMWNFSYVKRSKNGIFIDIIHSYFYPQDISADVTGIVTEYFYEFGGKELVKLKESDERVEVLHYLNNYFDGRFCNGKELPGWSNLNIQERIAWVKKCLRDFDSIKPGRSRKEIEKQFPMDGGVQGVSPVRFTHPECPHFKIEVEFSFKRNPHDQNRAVISPEDKTTKISKPYLERFCID